MQNIRYAITKQLDLNYSLDSDGKIKVNESEMEMDAMEFAESFNELNGEKLDDYISLKKKLPYGYQLFKSNPDESLTWIEVQRNFDV